MSSSSIMCMCPLPLHTHCVPYSVHYHLHSAHLTVHPTIPYEMIQHPPFVVAAEWDTMGEAKKCWLAALHEAMMDEEERIDPVL